MCRRGGSRAPAAYGHHRSPYKSQESVFKESNHHHEAAECDGTHVLPVDERILVQLSVVADVKADGRLHLVGDALNKKGLVTNKIRNDKYFKMLNDKRFTSRG